MTVKLLTEQHSEFLSLRGSCTCSSESTLVKCNIIGNHVMAQFFNVGYDQSYCIKQNQHPLLIIPTVFLLLFLLKLSKFIKSANTLRSQTLGDLAIS